MTAENDAQTHPEVPPDEWDGQHIDWETETCALCGGAVRYAGCRYCGKIDCADSEETLFLK